MILEFCLQVNIPEFRDRYLISELGTVLNTDYKILKQSLKAGYPAVTLIIMDIVKVYIYTN